MSNLISEFTYLSSIILEKEGSVNCQKPKKPSTADINKLRRIAFDCIHHFNFNNAADPCIISGAKWTPEIIISDYSYELERKSAYKASEVLWESVASLSEKKDNLICFEEILSFLLHLKQPYTPGTFVKEHPFSFSGHDYFFKNVNPFEVVPAEIFQQLPNQVLPQLHVVKDGSGLLDLFIERKETKNKRADPSFHLDQLLNILSPKIKADETANSASKNDAKKDSTVIKNSNEESKEDFPLSPWSAVLESIDKIDFLSEEKAKNSVTNYTKELDSAILYPKRKKSRLNSSKSQAVLDVCLHERELLHQIDDSVSLELYPVTVESYVRKVKLLLCGVNNDIFVYDAADKRFFMREGVCLNNVSPDTLFEFSKEFMEIGSCFFLLKESSLQGLRCDTDTFGLLYQSLWKNVFDYLQRHSDKVAEINSTTCLLELKEAIEELHATIKSLTKLCVAEPSVPFGGTLLTYLFEAFTVVSRKQLQQVLLSFLLECIAVYISKTVQTWVFEGHLDNVCSIDFFVHVDRDLNNHRNRHYYNGITSRDDQIPCFLNVIADRILACGKAVHLLELFNPENKFTQYLNAKKYPKMRFCWSEEDLVNLGCEYDAYQEQVKDLCGEHVTFGTIQNVIKVDEGDREDNVPNVPSTHIKTKDTALELKRKKQEEQYQMLKDQIEETARVRRANQEKEQLEDKRIEEEAIQIRAKEDEVIEKEKLRIKEYYNEINAKVAVVKERTEWQQKRLELSEKRLAFLDEDINNENNVLDEEGNIIPKSVTIEENANFLPKGEEIIPRSTEHVSELETFMTDEQGNFIQDNNQANNDNSRTSVDVEDNLNNPESNVTPDDNQNFRGPNDTITLDNGSESAIQIALENKAEAIKNKNKVLGCEYAFAMGNNVSESKWSSDVAAASEGLKNIGLETNTVSNEVTVAQKNKMKVLETEYYFSSKVLECGDMANANFVPIDSKDENNSQHENALKTPALALTEAQKNKLRVLGSEYEMALNEVQARTETCKVPTANEDLLTSSKCTRQGGTAALTEAQKNKKRVLGTELGIYIETAEKETPRPDPMALVQEVAVTESPLLSPARPEMPKYTLPSVTTFDDESSHVLFPSLPHLFSSNLQTDQVQELDPEQFLRQLLKSLDIALSAQERLANAAVLKHFFVDESFLSHVFSLRCYFLLHDGEFGRSLTHNLFKSLTLCTTPQEFFERNSLSHILNEAMNDTIYSSENAQNLSFQILEMPAALNHEAHNVLTPFQLSYKIKWPLNLILTDETLTRYRRIFHVLASLKRVHWTLNETFHHLKIKAKDKKLDGKRLMNSPHYTKLAVYRHAMTLFIMTLEEHMSANGLQEAWSLFQQDLDTATTLDHLYKYHVSYVKNLLRSCFLVKGSQDLLSYINELISLGLKFHYTLQSSTWHLVNEKHYEHPMFFALKTMFLKFCETTTIFRKTLARKVQHTEMKVHLPLLLLIDMKIKV